MMFILVLVLRTNGLMLYQASYATGSECQAQAAIRSTASNGRSEAEVSRVLGSDSKGSYVCLISGPMTGPLKPSGFKRSSDDSHDGPVSQPKE